MKKTIKIIALLGASLTLIGFLPISANEEAQTSTPQESFQTRSLPSQIEISYWLNGGPGRGWGQTGVKLATNNLTKPKPSRPQRPRGGGM